MNHKHSTMSASEAALLKVFSSLASVDTHVPEGLLSPSSDGPQSQESDLESLKLESEGGEGDDVQRQHKRTRVCEDLYKFQKLSDQMASVNQEVGNLRLMIVKRNDEIASLREQCQEMARSVHGLMEQMTHIVQLQGSS